MKSFLAILGLMLVTAIAETPVRTWTNQDGRVLEAALLGTEIDSVVVLTKAGARVVLPLEKLSEADQSFLQAWQRERSPEAALPPVSWPGGVSAGPVSISTPVQAEDGWGMDTVHYHFVCETELATSAVQELASAGEATHRWLKTWPLALPEPTEARSLARLFKTKASYTAAGGPEDSGGFFRHRRGRGELLVPYESLGLEPNPNGTGYRKSTTFSARTLVHEMTHQQMAVVLPLLPLWLSEGLAELAALPEYRDGKFRVSRELMLIRLKQRWEDYETRDPATGAKFSAATARAPGTAWTMSLTTLCNLDETSPGWVNSTLADKHRMYLSSLLTTFYFMYLEGDGQARRLRLYWQDVLQAQQYFATRGQSGKLPQGMDPRDPALPGVLMQRLFNNKTLPAWQADMQQRYSAVGLRVVFPSVP